MDPALPACDLTSCVPVFRDNWSDLPALGTSQYNMYPYVLSIDWIPDNHTDVLRLTGTPKRMRSLRTGRWFKKGIPNPKSYPLKVNSSGHGGAGKYLDTYEKLNFREN